MTPIARKPSELTPIRFIQVFSIDVVLASLALASMVNHVTATRMPWMYWIILPMAVWTIYTVDHLVDASTAGSKAHAYRHRIHLRYRKLLTIMVAVFGIGALVLFLIFLDTGIITAGIWLAVAAGAYFLLLLFRSDSRFRIFMKEPIVATIFTIGIWLAALQHWQAISPTALALLPIMFFTILSNLILNSMFEDAEDKSSGFSSLTTKIGKQWASLVFLITIMLSMVFSILVSLVLMEPAVMASLLLLTLIQVGFVLIYKYSEWTMHEQRYRFLGDMLFILCFLVIFA